MPRRMTLAVVLVGLLCLRAEAGIITGGLGSTPTVSDGSSLTYYAPHHFDPTPPHGPNPHPTSGGGTHYVAGTGDAHHFAWGSVTPATSGTLTIGYDFRMQNGFANLITPAQKANAIAALGLFSAATDGGSGPKLNFVLDTSSSTSEIINIGTGNLAALGFTGGPGGILGLGGGVFSHSGSTHSISSGVAWQDIAETWDTTIGKGNPSGTFDYFTVVFQEIGHAIGLGHTDNTGGLNLMDGNYTGEKTAPSAIDISHIRSVYGVSPATVPEPSSIALWSLLGIVLAVGRRRSRRKQ